MQATSTNGEMVGLHPQSPKQALWMPSNPGNATGLAGEPAPIWVHHQMISPPRGLIFRDASGVQFL